MQQIPQKSQDLIYNFQCLLQKLQRSTTNTLFGGWEVDASTGPIIFSSWKLNFGAFRHASRRVTRYNRPGTSQTKNLGHRVRAVMLTAHQSKDPQDSVVQAHDATGNGSRGTVSQPPYYTQMVYSIEDHSISKTMGLWYKTKNKQFGSRPLSKTWRVVYLVTFGLWVCWLH